MHRWITRVLIVACMAMLAAACTTSSDDGGDAEGDTGGGAETSASESEATTEAGEPQFGGTLVYGLEAETDGLHPAHSRFAIAGRMMAGAVFDTLARWDENGVAVPYLAESFTPNEDYTRWEIKLREGITFHDGEPLNADALIINLEEVYKDPLISLAVRPNLDEENPYEKVDEMTVAFNTGIPTGEFPSLVTGQIGMVGSPKWVLEAAEEGNEELWQRPVGTGPFMIDERVKNNKTVMVRNPDYWAGDVYLDAIEFRPITEETSRRQALLGGELNMAHTTDGPSILDYQSQDGLVLHSDDLGEETFILFDHSEPPFDDIRAREAVIRATDRDQYQQVVDLGTRVAANSWFHPDTIWHNPDVAQPVNDKEGAAALVADYCADVPDQCEDGKLSFGFMHSGPSAANELAAATLIDGSWADIFSVTREDTLQQEFITNVATAAYDAALYRLFGSPDPDVDRIWIDCGTISPLISLNWARQCDPEIQSVLEAQRAAPDRESKVELWKEIAQLTNDAHSYLYLSHTNWVIAHDESVQDVPSRRLADGSQGLSFFTGAHGLEQIWIAE